MAVGMNGQPWWFSGEDGSDGSQRPAGGVDFGALATGATQVVEWARSLIVAPHADHVDPHDHPQCLICQATRIMGPSAAPGSSPPPARHVEWIEVEWT